MSTVVEGRELDQIRQGDEVLLKELYKKHRTSFLRWGQRQYPGFADDVADIYQQAFTIFYFNVKSGIFTGHTSSIQTYLIGIGKNLLNKKAGSKNNELESLDDVPEISLPTETIFDKYEASHRQVMVKSILENVGEPCKTILTKYYFDNFTMESIAETLGYKSAMMAKKKKCECLIKIRKALSVKNATTRDEA